MTQILKGDTFADGQQVTGARLNQLLDSAQMLVGSITEQTAIASGTVASDDNVAISDTSTGALRKATVGDLLGSDIPLIASSLTAGSAKDVTVTPNDATAVTGSTYTSADGLTVVVTTSSAHGLSVGQVVLISGASAGYNGTFRLTVAAGTSFTYVMTTAATAGSGSLTYTKKGTEKVAGNLAVTGNSYVDGNETVAGTLRVTGSANLGATSVPSLSIGGKTPMTSEDYLSKVYIKAGTASGATGAGVENIVYQTPTLPTPPADETWTYEFWVQTTTGNTNGNTRPDYGAISCKVYNNSTLLTTLNASTSPYGGHTATFTFAKSYTSADVGAKLILKTLAWWGLSEEPKYLVRLTKVKTSTLSDSAFVI